MSVLPADGNPAAVDGSEAKQDPSPVPGQPSEVSLSDLKASLDKALGMLESHESKLRAIQSGKPGAVGGLSEIGTVKETLAKVAQHLGISEEQVAQASREMVLNDLVAERMSTQQPIAAPVGTEAGKGKLMELSDIDSTLGLPANDQRVANLKLLYGHDSNLYMAEGLKLRDALKQVPPLTPAEGLLPTGSVNTTVVKDRATLMMEYEKRRNEIAATETSHNVRVEKLTDLKTEFKKQGLDLN